MEPQPRPGIDGVLDVETVVCPHCPNDYLLVMDPPDRYAAPLQVLRTHTAVYASPHGHAMVMWPYGTPGCVCDPLGSLHHRCCGKASVLAV